MALYAFDGTWNDSSAPDEKRDFKKDTNVHRFRILYDNNNHQKVFYTSGVGTRYGVLGKYIGGVTGSGATCRVDEQFSILKKNFKKGDTDIDIVGYSRGASIARMFVQRIEKNFHQLEKNNSPLEIPPAVRFLGLFDTVASFGIPWSDDKNRFDVRIPEFVQNTFHAMALDETRETFGIERCLGNRDKITEVWFRGSHGDIGGNATYSDHKGERSNRERSDIALNWMLSKAHACELPVPVSVGESLLVEKYSDSPVTSQAELISIGKAGTLSRRIHIGDLVHYTVERTELTCGIDGRLLRRINVLTRIEDEDITKRADAMNWVPSILDSRKPDNIRMPEMHPSVVNLSLRRYPFDVLPARTWSAWLKYWQLEEASIAEERRDEFWAPSIADRALAWDLLVEMKTRIAVQPLNDNEGDDATALTSIYKLFPLSREFMRQHGVDCVNTAALVTAFLNKKVRPFTAHWHKRSVEEQWDKAPGAKHPEFREDLKSLQPELQLLTDALSHLADAKL